MAAARGSRLRATRRIVISLLWDDRYPPTSKVRWQHKLLELASRTRLKLRATALKPCAAIRRSPAAFVPSHQLFVKRAKQGIAAGVTPPLCFACETGSLVDLDQVYVRAVASDVHIRWTTIRKRHVAGEYHILSIAADRSMRLCPIALHSA